MNNNQLKTTAKSMVQKGKGILAADESTPTIGKRLQSVGVESTYETRNEYRDMLLTTNNIEKFISGVIMFDETIKQSTTCEDNIPFVKLLNDKGILPGIKVDMGAKELAGFSGEKITEGLDGLRERLQEYYEVGARFAKWRAVITIGEEIPSDLCISTNAHALARYASLCQEINIVPIVEPEVLMDGMHTIDICAQITEKTLRNVFEALNNFNVMCEGIVLKPNMVISGLECAEQAGIDQVSEMTVQCLKNTVPESVPGIAFLSGGQTSELATAHLNCMNRKYLDSIPWNLTFSYGRALQADALDGWNGNNRDLGQKNLIKRAQFNSMATRGQYSYEMEVDIV